MKYGTSVLGASAIAVTAFVVSTALAGAAEWQPSEPIKLVSQSSPGTGTPSPF
jgi:hypothetical protein